MSGTCLRPVKTLRVDNLLAASVQASQTCPWATPNSHQLAMGLETLAMGSCFCGFSTPCLTDNVSEQVQSRIVP